MSDPATRFFVLFAGAARRRRLRGGPRLGAAAGAMNSLIGIHMNGYIYHTQSSTRRCRR